MKSRCLGQFNIEQKGSNSFGTVFWYMQLRSQSQIEGLAFRTFVYQIELRSDFVQKYIVPSVNQISPIHLELDFSRLPPPKREKRANPRERPALIALKVFVCKSPELLEFQAGTFRKESWKIGLRKEDEVKESRMI
ncbi:hypothetical protein L1987_88733 [Smallanthus sonchifolius]|nr:hypothetical protein L1987_89925 [Smallanthus sonchifolius]KAI3666343.1 hypothetical protein L1987_89149 [Smallanthus sonchifolius]KAI3666618.1 hypothetical protein L1987_88865 [Smallanthus sonchifolius]KAI3666650.1 hypothetical protein L1987_88832 [Smallanthus sonchifolius]KAI3666730.1 hypothetical protein L1987_88733 [Smallanthus sonchifolius]